MGPVILGSSNTVAKLKHLLSDLWRVFDFLTRWQWKDQERTVGTGNATLSTESDNLHLKVKTYNVQTGFVKKVSETLELVDILEAKTKFFRCVHRPLAACARTRRAHMYTHAWPFCFPRHGRSAPCSPLPPLSTAACAVRRKMKELVDECLKKMATDPTAESGLWGHELLKLATAVVQPLIIIADLEIGRNGFHRADVVNLTWAELHPTFTGLHDLPATAKRRYTGLDFVEAANCGCSKYGPFCCAFGPRASQEEVGKGDTLVLLRHISACLGAYVSPEAVDARSSCPVCSLVLVNYFLNVLYHDHVSDDVPYQKVMSSSRPQEGFVFPQVVRFQKSRSKHLFDEEVHVKFDRSHIKDQVSRPHFVYRVRPLCIHRPAFAYTQHHISVYM